MSTKRLLGHKATTLHWVKVSDGLPEMLTTSDAFLSDLTPEELINHKWNRLHTFLYDEEQLNYIFPCIKEFNQQYYSIEYRR